jgi:hypothetical protein
MNKKKKRGTTEGTAGSYQITVPKLTPVTSYSFRVVSVNKYGESLPCKSCTGDTSSGIPRYVASYHMICHIIRYSSFHIFIMILCHNLLNDMI